MRDQELRELIAAIRAQMRARGGGLPAAERERLVEERLAALLKARYATPDADLPEETKQAAVARLVAAARANRCRVQEAAPAGDARWNGRQLGLLALRQALAAPQWERICWAVGLATAVALVVVVGRRNHGPGERSGQGGGDLPRVTLVRAPAGAQVPEGLPDPAGILHLTYGRRGNAYYVQASDSRFETATRPVRLNRRPGSVWIGGERGPKLALGTDGVIHVVWLSEGPRRQGVWYTRSMDGGRSFEAERNVLDARTHCESATVAADRQGNVWIFWLDGRLPPDPDSPLASPIFMARSTDGGRTFSRNELVRHDHPGLACACCQLEARLGPDENLYLSFRSGYRNIRDAYLLKAPKLENNFRSVRVSPDDWLFAG
jgi:hypothetical protein